MSPAPDARPEDGRVLAAHRFAHLGLGIGRGDHYRRHGSNRRQFEEAVAQARVEAAALERRPVQTEMTGTRVLTPERVARYRRVVTAQVLVRLLAAVVPRVRVGSCSAPPLKETLSP